MNTLYTPLTIEQRQYCKQLQKTAVEQFRGKCIHNVVDIQISTRGIKEFLNQPHPQYLLKNELIKKIDVLLQTATYIGTFPPHKTPNIEVMASLFYQIDLLNTPQYLIVHKYKNGSYFLHSISPELPNK